MITHEQATKAALEAYEEAETLWAEEVAAGRSAGALKRRVDRLARTWAELDSADAPSAGRD